jgi:hypothetical protein
VNLKPDDVNKAIEEMLKAGVLVIQSGNILGNVR